MTLTERIQRGSEALYELASAEVDRGVIAIRMAGSRLAIRVVGLILATYGAIGVAGAIVVVLTPRLGLMWSLLLVSMAVLTLGVGISALASAFGGHRATSAQNQARIESAKATLSDAFDPTPEKSEPRSGDSPNSLKDQFEAAMSDPRVLTSAAFAAMSIVGPFRLLKLATRGAGAASAVAALVAAVRSSRVKTPHN